MENGVRASLLISITISSSLFFSALVILRPDTGAANRSAVGSVEWNITGTVLSSAGNDGRIRLWKATSGNVWRPAGSIGVEATEETHDADVEMDENGGRS